MAAIPVPLLRLALSELLNANHVAVNMDLEIPDETLQKLTRALIDTRSPACAFAANELMSCGGQDDGNDVEVGSGTAGLLWAMCSGHQSTCDDGSRI